MFRPHPVPVAVGDLSDHDVHTVSPYCVVILHIQTTDLEALPRSAACYPFLEALASSKGAHPELGGDALARLVQVQVNGMDWTLQQISFDNDIEWNLFFYTPHDGEIAKSHSGSRLLVQDGARVRTVSLDEDDHDPDRTTAVVTKLQVRMYNKDTLSYEDVINQHVEMTLRTASQVASGKGTPMSDEDSERCVFPWYAQTNTEKQQLLLTAHMLPNPPDDSSSGTASSPCRDG